MYLLVHRKLLVKDILIAKKQEIEKYIGLPAIFTEKYVYLFYIYAIYRVRLEEN